jgi:hypothetical protein
MLYVGKHLPYLNHGKPSQAFDLYAPKKEDLPLMAQRLRVNSITTYLPS